jgi:hypothetical protein
MRPVNTLKSLTAAAICAAAVTAPAAGARDDDEQPSFSDPTRIDNPYLPISKFHRCTLKGEEDGERLVVKRTLLDRTKTFTVDGATFEAAVVKDRVHADGELVEHTLDFFAQDDSGAVRYLGERVDNYENGRVVDHHGSWLYGRDTEKIGVLMPGKVHVGVHWMSEDSPPDAVEFDRIVAELREAEVRGRTYDKVIKVREWTLPDREVEHKLYAKGVGVIDELPPDGEVGLVGCSR